MEAKHGLTVKLPTLTRMRSTRSALTSMQVSNPFNPAYDRGSGALDRRHDFNANYIYALPFFAQRQRLAA